MVIDVLTVSGSPKNILPKDIYTRGVGGAELALLTWAEIMSQRGHQIRIFNQNNTLEPIWINENLTFLPDNLFLPDEDRDVLITFRGPQDIAQFAKGRKIGWSCDQFTVGNYHAWYVDMEKIVLISPFHLNDHLNRYSRNIVGDKGIVVDLGVVTEPYLQELQKEPYSFIFCSVPDRGLYQLADLWPDIKERWPEATLTITSDYTLWGASDPLNMSYRMRFAGMPGVRFLGNIPREELIKEQLKAEVQLYPCIYDENFCLANAECQVAGCYCITTDIGALKTTNFTGITFPAGLNNYTNYFEALTSFFNQPYFLRSQISKQIQKRAIDRFDWNNIAKQWEELLHD